ncbi:hypothetical protein KP509_13G014300 [Ceratopteris richardii]|uniref:Uncharacterized protein n=3 Tax=Ceratopteris richardii TaxID=49495 RepID=A0A8T2TFM5_CERRI|nr:hypothetical protein KP509_13G014300 [Ceratopteris richardii]
MSYMATRFLYLFFFLNSASILLHGSRSHSLGTSTSKTTKRNSMMLNSFSSSDDDYDNLFPNGTGIVRADFPSDFLFGAITSAMKHEGAELEDGKSLNIWDQYARNVTGATLDGLIPGECGDSYHQYSEDHDLVAGLGMNAYRMSIAWSRIYPNSTHLVNDIAIEHYNKVIDDALEKGLEIFVTLWTQDHPHYIDETYMGPLNYTFVEDFVIYANTCFAAFGDRVKYWITFDEPNDYAGLGYATNQNPPGRCTTGIENYGKCWEGDSGTEPYIVRHHLLLAHAETAHLYKTRYQESQNGSIGIALWHRWFEPLTNTSSDLAASQRATDFLLGWFLDPIFYGDYPASMKEYAGDGLPELSSEESAKVKGSVDFIGLNVITAFYVYEYDFYEEDYPNTTCYYLDPKAAMTGERDNVSIGVGNHDYAVPWIIRKTLEYIKYKYHNFPSYITQTGEWNHI